MLIADPLNIPLPSPSSLPTPFPAPSPLNRRCQLGLPADEPGREQVVQRITSKDQWWRLMSFLYTSIDLALFPQGIPDETPQRAAEDLQLLQQAAADAAMQAAGTAAAAMGRETGPDVGSTE